MKGFIKKFLVFLLISIVSVALAKCEVPASDTAQVSSVTSKISLEELLQNYNISNIPSNNQSNITSDNTSNFLNTFSSSSYYTPSSNYSNNSAPQSEDAVKTFYNLNDLRDYLNQQKNANNFKINFKYKGSDKLAGEMLAQMTNSFYIEYNTKGDLYTLYITEYPGDHIVDAYFSGNKSNLTADEIKAMDKAISILNTAKSKAKNNWELELQIHNTLANSITYYDNVRDFDDPEKAPRNLSILGALLDGKANCQGYSDAFYTIASMAGFTVSRMSVETPDDLHQVNTILLNGSWYVVDVTFDDQEGSPIDYRLFNAGLEQISEFTWKPWKEVNKISATSGNDYYYKRMGIFFEDTNAFSNYVVNKWLKGEKSITAAIKNQSDLKAVEKSLNAALDKTGKSYSYSYYYTEGTKDFFCTVKFK